MSIKVHIDKTYRMIMECDMCDLLYLCNAMGFRVRNMTATNVPYRTFCILWPQSKAPLPCHERRVEEVTSHIYTNSSHS